MTFSLRPAFSLRSALAAASVFALALSMPALAEEAAPAAVPAPVTAAEPAATPAPAADAAAPATETPAKPVVKKKRKFVSVGSASVPMPTLQTPWSNIPTLDGGSLERLNQLSQFYAAIARNGGFPAAPPVGLGPRATGTNVLNLRARLVMEKDLSESERDIAAWDDGLTGAVKNFQMRYGLIPTGKIDDRTRAQMAVPVRQRLTQIGHNMERLGARFIDFNHRYVVVNIPSAQVEAIEGTAISRKYVAVVGRPKNPSPEVDATISAVNFNPTWTVPQSIIKKEIGPHMVRDPGYLSRQRMKVLDGSGKPVDPAGINWASDKIINYTIRQDYGGGNALGQLRIQMPNSESVYMHDTPSKNLFGSVDRFFSHGCVRVQGVNDLAAWLLGPGWDAKRVAQEIGTGQRKDAAIPDRVPVHWVYMTAYVTPDGTAHFRPDVYGIDFGNNTRISQIAQAGGIPD